MWRDPCEADYAIAARRFKDWLRTEKNALKVFDYYALLPQAPRKNTIAGGYGTLHVAVPFCSIMLLRGGKHRMRQDEHGILS